MAQTVPRRTRGMWGRSKIWQAGDKQDCWQHRSGEATGACRSSTERENDFWAFHWQRHSVEHPYWKLGNAQADSRRGLVVTVSDSHARGRGFEAASTHNEKDHRWGKVTGAHPHECAHPPGHYPLWLGNRLRAYRESHKTKECNPKTCSGQIYFYRRFWKVLSVLWMLVLITIFVYSVV